MNFFPAETISFSPPAQEERSLSLPERILQRSDLALVGTGSLSCLRALYLTARDMGKCHQFFSCMISAEEYAAGRSEARLRAVLEHVLSIPGVGGVVIYASCMDVLNQTDFDTVIAQLENPGGVPVRVLLRGPMVKRYRRPARDLQALLADMPDTGRVIPASAAPLPPLSPDFNCISSFLQTLDCYPFLVTAGGCGGAVEALGEGPYRLKHSRLNDIQVSLGCSELIRACVAQDVRETYPDAGDLPPICLMGSAVPAFTGLDGESLADALGRDGMPAYYLPSNGFRPGPPGLADALLTLGRVAAVSHAEEPQVLILGHCEAMLGKKQKLAEAVRLCREMGAGCTFWGEKGLTIPTGPAVSWVVSAPGLPLARWLQEEFGIPYLTGIPVGAGALYRWQERLRRLFSLERRGRHEPPEPVRADDSRSFLLVQEPLLMESIREFLQEELSGAAVTMAVYAPLPAVRRFYQTVCPELPLRYFATAEEFAALTEGVDHIIADPALRPYSRAGAWTSLPDPQLSGTQYVEMPYALFAEEGAAYLRENIKTNKGEMK